jgi:hypothetical protein
MVRRSREHGVRAHSRSERERLDVPAATGVARPLVEDDEDDTAPQLRRAQERHDMGLQPRVAGRDRAVVHVVAEVRDDEREVGEPVGPEVVGELGEGDDAVTARPRVGDVPEVEERIVLLRVPARG